MVQETSRRRTDNSTSPALPPILLAVRGKAKPHRLKKTRPIEINNHLPTPVSPYLHVAERQRLPRSLAKKSQKYLGRTAYTHEAKACVSRAPDTELCCFNKMPDYLGDPLIPPRWSLSQQTRASDADFPAAGGSFLRPYGQLGLELYVPPEQGCAAGTPSGANTI